MHIILIDSELFKNDNSLRESFDITIDLDEINKLNDEYYQATTIRLSEKTGSNLKIESDSIPDEWCFENYYKSTGVLFLVYDTSEDNKRGSVFISKKLNKFSNVLDLMISLNETLFGGREINLSFVKRILAMLFKEDIELDYEKFSNLFSEILHSFCEETGEAKLVELYTDHMFNISKSFDDKGDDTSKKLMREMIRIVQGDQIKEFETALKNRSNVSIDYLKRSFFNDFKTFYRTKNGEVFIDFSMKYLKELLANVEAENREDALELFVYLYESVRVVSSNENNSWVIPSFKVGTKREFDCMTMKYDKEKIVIEIIEVSTTNRDGKTLNDLNKNKEIINRLQKNYDDIEVVKKIIAPKLNVKIESIDEIIQS